MPSLPWGYVIGTTLVPTRTPRIGHTKASHRLPARPQGRNKRYTNHQTRMQTAKQTAELCYRYHIERKNTPTPTRLLQRQDNRPAVDQSPIATDLCGIGTTRQPHYSAFPPRCQERITLFPFNLQPPLSRGRMSSSRSATRSCPTW
jgi:hypothetical protein